MNATDIFGISSTVFPDGFGSSTMSDDVTKDLVGLLATSTMMPDAMSEGGFWNFRKWLGNLVMKSTTSKLHGSFLQGFIASLSFIVVSEIGDKTFFIAAIMAMKHPRLVVFSGAISALVFMTILSAAFGSIASVIPRVYTYYASAVLFAIFGLKMLRDGYKMDPNGGQEELEEVQMELKRREDQKPNQTASGSPTSTVSTTPVLPENQELRERREPEALRAPIASPESPSTPLEPVAGPSNSSNKTEPLREDKDEAVDMLEQGQAELRRRRRRAICKVFLQAASLTFVAEWGDRSQLMTVVLATREDVAGVIVGGSLGHALCTGGAVIGGRMLAQRISVRTVTIIGGLVFLFFAISALFIDPSSD